MFSKKSGLKIYHNTPTQLTPQDILPTDDSFHGLNKHVAAERWYFDAVFTKDYSLHIGCRIFSRKNIYAKDVND